MREFKNQIKISEELANLLDFLEVYNSAASVGVAAFSVSEPLVLRFMLDNIADRSSWYEETKKEIDGLIREVQKLAAIKENEDFPLIYPRNESLPEYYLESSEILPWFRELYETVSGVKGSNVLP
ncbi:MAG: hypothetical protein OEX03_07680 [Gammaproteobacteria bacterium]|nr:hypothetical protein [Gammaproteobacteria bacterium]